MALSKTYFILASFPLMGYSPSALKTASTPSGVWTTTNHCPAGYNELFPYKPAIVTLLTQNFYFEVANILVTELH